MSILVDALHLLSSTYIITHVILGTCSNLGESMENLAPASTKFALDLYKEIIAQPEMVNVAFSPLNIGAALAILKLGTRGNSSEQVAECLHLQDIESAHIKSAFSELNGIFHKAKDNLLTTKEANGVFISNSITVGDDFKHNLSVFGAKIIELDFQDNTSVSHINKWFAQETGGLVTDMLNEKALNSRNVIIFASALYFSGDWHSGFTSIEKGEFYPEHIYEVIEVQFMRQKGRFRFRYVESLELQILEMPFIGEDICMIVFSPLFVDLEVVEENLNYENITNWISSMEYTTVDITFPKFKLEVGIELKNILQNLGIKDIFSSGKVDLSGMSGENSLFVDEIFHKSVIEVTDEDLTEVATAFDPSFDYKTRFVADQPFIWMIRQRSTGRILLIGRLKKPDGPVRGPTEL